MNLQVKSEYDANVLSRSNPNYLQVSYHYDGAGRLLDRILSNGVKTRYDYDVGGRLTQLKNTSGSGQIVNDTQYTRDRLGNILTQTEAAGTGQTAGITSYTYDPEYRLLTADYPGTQNDEAFTYDKVGNRKTYTQGSLTANATTRYYQYNSGNRLIDQRTGSGTGIVFESYQYDDNGSLTQIGGNRTLILTWDVNNRPDSIGGTTYQYDPAGYRIDKSGSQSRHYYLEGEHLENAYDGSGNLHAQYFRGSIIDEVVNGYQRDTNNKLVNYSYHHDALQSVLGQSGHEGSILATQTYGAFGNPQSQTGTSNNKLKYTGREEDSESGCYYYRARYYCPGMGRFISEDPIGLAGGINRYVYVGNNPVNSNDPSGNCPSCIGAGVSVVTGGIIRGITSGGDLGLIFNPGAILQDAALGAVGAGLANKLNQFSQLAGLPVSTIQKLGASGSIEINQGVYLAESAAGKYVGQSGQITSRLEQHVSNSRFGFDSASAANDAIRFSVAGGQTSREVFEQSVLNSIGGKNSLGVLNLVNPIGAARQSLLDNPFLGQVNNIFVPNISPVFSSVVGVGAGAASGGFVLYPNKANTNMMQSVYSK